MQEVEERMQGKIYDGRSLIFPQFGDDENEHKWQSLKQSRIDNGEQWKMFERDITDTLRIADAYVDDKKRALCATADKEKFLRAECERIVKENDRLLDIQSENVAIHRQVTNRLDNDLKSMITDHNELEQQLRESKLPSRLDKEEFERLLPLANQCKVAVQKKRKTKAFLIKKHISSIIQLIAIWQTVLNCLVMIMSIP